jgi:copper(I)-binding protein
MRRSVLIAMALVPALFASIAPAAVAAPAQVVVADSWVRASSFSDHTGGMTGVFMKITNKTKRAITLLSGTSSIAAMVETHQVVDGVMSKTARGIKIMPGKTVILEPGGLHVMLMGLKRPILAGTKVDLTLKFAGASPLVLKPMLAKTAAAGDETYDPGMNK